MQDTNLGNDAENTDMEDTVDYDITYILDEDTEIPDFDTLITVEDMVLISVGTFQMGSPTDELGRYSDETVHTVTLTKKFYMNKYEVTQGEFSSAMGYNPSYFSTCGD